MGDDVEFTVAEQELLRQHLRGYERLASGKAPANTEARRHFIAVLQGHVRAETLHEIAFMKYRRWQAQQRATLHNTGADEELGVGQAAYPDHVWNKLKNSKWPKGYRGRKDL